MNRVIFCIFLCFSLHVSGVEIVRDSNGFVKLFYHADQPHTATLLSWEKSPNGYGRPVTAIKMKANKELSAQEAKTFWINKVNDKNSVTLVEKSQIEIKSDLILNEKIMDRTILSSVRQIEGGASQYSSLDADQYINKNSLSLAQYTREMNIQLTRTLGAEFSSQVYKSLLLRETKTQDSMQLFTALLESNLQAKDTQFDGATELWVAKGLMQNTEDVEKVKGMFEKVLALMAEKGLPVFTFKTRTGDTVQTNADIIASTLENRTTNNRKIVILAVSKAVPEVLGGLAKLNTKGFFDKTENKGLISGVILTAGPQNGMHFADFASMPLVFSIIKNKVASMAAANKVDISNLKAGFKSLSHKKLGAYYETILPQIPHVPYINLVGVSKAGTGYAEYKPLQEMQEGLFNRWFFPTHGANDGIVEYSSLLKTSRLGQRAVTLLADGDHCIFPCEFKGREVNSNEEQMKSFSALFSFIDILNRTSGDISAENLCRSHFKIIQK